VNAISARSLGKKFKLFRSQGKRLLEYLTMGKISHHTDFWALQDITFEIPTGTTLGVLGQNGSGKSTLLSILAGVLEPSAGSFEINGKVSAILELGSGFHPEFSGRDNVYMYGSIMGLSKEDIDDRFDEIVRFSELGDFIDQPIRTYSTGMTVRLAFSVAVNVNADILIVDEALAVGDAIFQHRCFRKIREMQEAGKTILYVGHDTEAVRNLCTQALLLDGGRIIERGDPNYVVNKYYALISDRERTYREGNLIEHGEIPGDEYETVYDFVRNLEEAKIESAEGIPVQPQTVEIQSTPRRVIFAHPPSRVTYTVPVESGSSLAFAIGILPAAWDKIPQGVKFDIEVACDGETDTIFSRMLQPKRNIGDKGWHNFLVSLERYTGKTITIDFINSGSGDDLSYCWAAWGWIRLIKKTGCNPVCNLVCSLEIKEIDTKEKLQFAESLPQEAGLSSHNMVLYGNKKATILKVEILDKNEVARFEFNSGEFIIVKTYLRINVENLEPISVGLVIKNKFVDIYGINTHWEKCDLVATKVNDIFIARFSVQIDLAPDMYWITSGCSIFHSEQDIEYLNRWVDCNFFKVISDKKIPCIVDFHGSVEIKKVTALK
jgi:ABC-type polysaccharide/polyol phosphate transport system ATPase subunit